MSAIDAACGLVRRAINLPAVLDVPTGTDEGMLFVSRSTGATGNASRFTVRTCAAALLLLGVVGGAHLAEQRKMREASAEAAAAQVAAVEEFRELVEERAREDDARWSAIAEAAEVAEDEAEAAAQQVSRVEEAASRRRVESREPPAAPPVPVSSACNAYSGNRATGCALLLEAGFALDQMPCLDSLWTKESGWNHLAHNSFSGAYGIPQALPGSKMASHGADWETNPATQIRWGLSYIQGRYSTPCGAWQQSQNTSWY